MTTKRSRARNRSIVRALVTCLAVVVGAITLSSCGGTSANTLGHEACVDVAASIKLFDEGEHNPTAADAASEKARALAKLRAALQPAAIAGSSDGSWQALMATLSESSRVNEAYLIPALTDQCAATLNTQ